MLSDIPSIEKFIRISKKIYGEELYEIPRFNGYLSMITEPNSKYLLWLKQYFYYLHKYNPNKQREIQVGNKLYKLNDLVRLKDSKDLVHITDITNESKWYSQI